MRNILLIWMLFFTACAVVPQNRLSKFAKDMDDRFALPTYSAEFLQDQDSKAIAAFIYTVLFNTSELNTHRMNGETGNQVYIHEKGAEVVFDKNGVIVKKCENMGSFNYAHPHKQPLGHFSVDSLPWLIWGNCHEDTTTLEQRVYAYIEDLEVGLNTSRENNVGYYLPEGFDFSQPGQSLAVAFFIAALDDSRYNLIEFIMSGQSNNDKRQEFFSVLKKGFLRFHIS